MPRHSAALPLRILALALLSTLAFASARAATDPAADLLEHGAFKRARAELERRLAAHPDDPMTLALMGQVKLFYGDLASARAMGERAVQMDPNNAEFHLWLGEAYGVTAQKAPVLRKMGWGKKFRHETETAIALDPRQVEARENMMQFFLVAPGIAGGDKNKAKVMAAEIVAIDPARGQLALARIALSEKDSATADARYRDAARVDPTSYDGRIGAANWFAYSRDNLAEAERDARAALEVGPDRIGAYAVLAAVYAHGERWPELDGILESAERAVPDNFTAHFSAAATLITEKKDAPRAERYLRQYLGVEPEPNRPSWARAHWRLAGALEQQSKKAQAVAELETAIKLDPGFDDAKKDLKRLKRA